MKGILTQARVLYLLDRYTVEEVAGHDGGRNKIFICTLDANNKYVLRISELEDRTEKDYLAETDFVHYLAANNAPVADVIASIHGRLVEMVEEDGKLYYISMFAYAKGKLLCENGYRYKVGAPIEELFFNTGKTLGAIHRLSKQYSPVRRRSEYADKYNKEYIDKLIPDDYSELKEAIYKRFDEFAKLPKDKESYGLVHFDFSDGNYHINFLTGEITVFAFDICMYCGYMFDLANLWTHGVGWCHGINSPEKRLDYMHHYFETVLSGYVTETKVPEKLLAKLPLFIDMVLIENIVDEFECAAREGEELDYEDIEDAAECLINSIPYAGVGR